jgi:transcriptional regulator with XRE-family HTH domain
VSLAELGRELREARRSAGLRQADVARAAGISPSWISRIERGLAAEVGVRMLSILLAIVGLDLSARAYPGGHPLRDEGHRRVRERARCLLPESAPWQTEVPVAGRGDLRAWDALTRLWGLRVAIEVELRPSDMQALDRRLALKFRDGDVDRLVLVIADTRHNRALLRLVADDLARMFPIQGSAARAALRAPRDPGCNLLVLA